MIDPKLFTFIVIVVLVMALNAWLFYHWAKSSDHVIREWAEEQGYRILEMERRSGLRKPYNRTISSQMQKIYYVLIDDNGEKREAFIRLGSLILGVVRNKFQIRWVQPGTKETVVENYR